MGWFKKLGKATEIANRAAERPGSPLVSPWSDSSPLVTATVAKLWPEAGPGAVTRAEAMKVAAVTRGRGIITSMLARHPLKATKDGARAASPPWVSRSVGDLSPQHRMIWTIDDLIFRGVALWSLERNQRGQVTNALYTPRSQWSVTPTGTIEVLGKPVSAEQVCFFQSFQDGLLTIGADTIRRSLDTENAWGQRVASPIPVMNLEVTDQLMRLTPEESKDLAKKWDETRRLGGTAVTPYGLKARAMGTEPTDLFEGGRNALRLDIANFFGLPADLLEGARQRSGLHYSTQEGDLSFLGDVSLTLWSTPIEARLSLDDMCPRGTAIQFDMDWLTRRPLVED